MFILYMQLISKCVGILYMQLISIYMYVGILYVLIGVVNSSVVGFLLQFEYKLKKFTVCDTCHV